MSREEFEKYRDKMAETFMIDPEIDQGVSKESFRTGMDLAFDWCQQSIKDLRNSISTTNRAQEKLNLEADALGEEIKSLKFNLAQKSKEIGKSEHRGNTVDYIYDKCENYGKQFDYIKAEAEALVECLKTHGHDNRSNPNCDMCKALTRWEAFKDGK